MSPITHFLASWTLGDVTGCDRRDRALVGWAGVLPDADGLGAVVDVANGLIGRPETWYYGLYHHVLLHGFPGAILIPAILCVFAVNRVRMFVVGVLAVHLHLLCDLVGSRGPAAEDIWPIHYLAPIFQTPSFSWSGQWALNAWPNIVFTLALVAWSFCLAVRRGYSPVGAVSPRADAVFVKAVKNRWVQFRSGRS